MYDIDKVDRQIIRALQRDGRASNVEIARQIGVTEGTIRKRLGRLLEDNVIRIATVLDPSKVGYSTHAYIGLEVESAALDSIIERLNDLPEVRVISLTTGEFDLIIEGSFRNDSELLNFLAGELGSIDGIRNIATSHMMRTIKSGYMWEIPHGKKPEILIVDDDPDFREFCRTVLTEAGYRANSATTGDEALTRMRTTKPDLIILDIMMDGILDGLNVSRMIRSDRELAQVPVVMVSSITHSPYSGLLRTEGDISVSNFLSKPIVPDKLVSEVRRQLTVLR